MSASAIPAGAVLVCAVVLVSLAVGLWWRARSGRIRRQGATSAAVITAGQLGAPLGARATLVQFSSAFCQPCRTTRLTLAQVCEMVPGVRHIDVDAEANLGLVRTFDIRRTPTVLIADAGGRIAYRASGAPRKDQVLTVLAGIVEGPDAAAR